MLRIGDPTPKPLTPLIPAATRTIQIGRNNSSGTTAEFRSVKLSGIRTESEATGEQYLVGYAALYNVISHDLGWGMRERILPGAFTRSIVDNLDVYHLVNHDPSQILGRTLSGTTTLSEDAKGLRFRTLINKDDPSAVALAARVARGDIDTCSFGFIVRAKEWTTARNPDNPDETIDVREVSDLDLFDVSTVTYPAYPKTNTALAALRADGRFVPEQFRNKVRDLTASAAAKDAIRDMGIDDTCLCGCLACMDGDCDECDNADCSDPNCRCMASARSTTAGKTRKVDGEEVTRDGFLFRGAENDPKSWKMPVRFKDKAKTAKHLRGILGRFNSLGNVDDAAKAAAWTELLGLCKDNGIDLSTPEDAHIRAKLSDVQLSELTFDAEANYRKARQIEIESSL